MIQTSTSDLLILHTYGETTEEQKNTLAQELAANAELHEELMELIRGKRFLNRHMKSPSDTSVRIIMQHSFKSEHLQEI